MIVRVVIDIDIDGEKWQKDGSAGDAADVAAWVGELVEYSRAMERGEVLTYRIAEYGEVSASGRRKV